MNTSAHPDTDTFSTTIAFGNLSTPLPARDGGNSIRYYYLFFVKFGYLPVSAFGVIGNALSFWIWQCESSYGATVFTLKILALWDFIHTAGNFRHVLGEFFLTRTFYDEKIFRILILIAQVASVNTTLFASVTRFVAVYRPTRLHEILPRARVAGICMGILLWSVLLTSLETALNVCQMTRTLNCTPVYNIVDRYRSTYTYDILAFFIPLFLLACTNAATIWNFRQHGLSSGLSRERHQQKSKRLTLTMIIVSLTSLVSYPFAIIVRLVVSPNGNETDFCDTKCKYILIYCCALMTIFNSSVNVVYYFAFASRFRQLFMTRMNKPCPCGQKQ